MFCPKCATQNLEGASYCRVCGANISLVPQALSGQLPEAREENAIETGRRRRRGKRGELSLDHAFKNVFMGIAFLLIAIALSFSMGRGWWFWMLLPAFSMMGTGVAQYIRLKEAQKRAFAPSGTLQPSIPAAPHVNSFPTRHTGELVPPPPSVTESTTRHLGAEAPTRHLDSSNEFPK
jgi:hypothetical protein